MPWIELKDGCEMPDIDEFVLWRNEHGNFFVRAIDKDDNAWWKGEPWNPGSKYPSPKCTHWKRIAGPFEEDNPDLL